MRKNQPSLKDRASMLQNYGHIHNYVIFSGYSRVKVGHRYVVKKAYRCSMCEAMTYQY